MNQSRHEKIAWSSHAPQFDLFARNISMDYLALGVDLVIGVFMLPFNLSYLGQSTYGLLVLAASITMYFSIFNLGFGDAQVRFAAQCRARRDSRALNQITSTLFFVFIGIGLIVYGVALLLAFNLESLFNITRDQATVGKQVLLILGAYVALGFPIGVFGGIVNGFQRHYLNGGISIASSVIVALVNVAVLLSGYGLVELVAATTLVRVLGYLGYAANAYRVFPALRIRPRYFRLSRLNEVAGFSTFILLIDLANKLNYSADTIVIGISMSTAAIAVWAVAQRLIDMTQRLTGQLNGALFPVVVDTATLGQIDRLRMVLLQGTRLSLAMVIVIATGLALLAHPVVMLWVGPQFSESIPVIYILAVAVVIRVGNSTATTLLKGAGRHRLLAFSNVAIAVANLALSLLLARSLGLIGVALGTLIPLGLVSLFVLFPAACRRADLPLTQAFTKAVWPAVWPAALMAIYLIFIRDLAGISLTSVLVQSASAGFLYVTLFLCLALKREDRQWYLSKLIQLARRPRIASAV